MFLPLFKKKLMVCFGFPLYFHKEIFCHHVFHDSDYWPGPIEFCRYYKEVGIQSNFIRKLVKVLLLTLHYHWSSQNIFFLTYVRRLEREIMVMGKKSQKVKKVEGFSKRSFWLRTAVLEENTQQKFFKKKLGTFSQCFWSGNKRTRTEKEPLIYITMGLSNSIKKEEFRGIMWNQCLSFCWGYY